MFKKNKKQTETIKEPKEKKGAYCQGRHTSENRDCVVGGAIASVSFGVYKNFTAIDQHTTHEKRNH